MVNINRLLEGNGKSRYVNTQTALDNYGFTQQDLDRFVLNRYLTPKKDRNGFSLWDFDELERMADRLKPVTSMNWISPDEAEEAFGIGLQMLKQLAREKIVTPRQISKGGEFFISRDALQSFVDEFN